VKLIVGLGNPGRDYHWTRHNVGFLLVERVAEKNGIDLPKRGLKSIYGRGKIGKKDVILAKPQTFMNLSGEAVQRLLRFFKIPPEDLIVLHDDLDLPWGKIRIRLQGGAGGHKGIKSIIESLGFDAFVRFKVGIGRPGKGGQDPADFVLEPLSGGEREEFKEMVNRNAEAVEILLLEGPQEAMNRFHKDGGDKDA
jgi:peptidyl-tRNA hydrolase, PTH1 family